MPETLPKERPQDETLHQDIDRYLKQLRQALVRLPQEDREDIIRETQSHFLDRLELDATLNFPSLTQGFGSPNQYAQRFVDSYELSSALASGSPWRMMRAAGRLIGRGVGAFVGFIGFLSLYAMAFGFAAVALLKPIFPAQVGFWTGSNPLVFNIGFLPHPPPTATEHLGYWLIPMGLTLALLIYVLTNKLLRRFLDWLRGRSGSGQSDRPPL